MIEKLVVVTKKTSLEELLRRHVTLSQVKFYLQTSQDSCAFYQKAHAAYYAGLEKTLTALPKMPQQQIDKEYLPTYSFGEKDLVIVVGDAGLVVNVAKYVGNQPIIAVNPDEERYDNTLGSCTPKTFSQLLQLALQERAPMKILTMAEATLDNGQVLYALNDLFVGRKTHVSARYTLSYQNKKERQSSSGIIISTGTGSTGWLTSIAIMTKELGGGFPSTVPFSQDAEYLLFTVREPFPTKITGTSIIHGKITQEDPLVIISHMPEEGVIFSDGIEQDYLEFPVGRTVIIKPAEKRARLVYNQYD